MVKTFLGGIAQWHEERLINPFAIYSRELAGKGCIILIE